jgi:hypothetical protein
MLQAIDPTLDRVGLEQDRSEHDAVPRSVRLGTQLMLDRVISGGESGVDQAALRAARAAGIPTGGTAPKGWETEDGPVPWLADSGLVECAEPGYPPRTIANVHGSDGTLWLGATNSPGGRLTIATARAAGRPLRIVEPGVTTPSDVRRWLAEEGVKVLNVAGNRESTEPGIGERAEAFLAVLFRITQSDSPSE